MPLQQDDLYIFESPMTGMLKIGHSKDPMGRLSSGTTFCPDPDGRIIIVIPGEGHREQDVHRAFAAHHSHKEWFSDCPEIRNWIAGGCDLSLLPEQLNLPRPMRHSISKKHNPQHVEGLLNHLEAMAWRTK